MKSSTFKRILSVILVLCMVLPFAVMPASAAEVSTTIKHTQTTGESNYFTFSPTGWSAMGSSDAHVWSDDPTSNPSAVWYEVKFVGHKIDVYAGGNWPMGYVEYFIDGVSQGEYNLYLPSNQDSRLVKTFDNLTEGEHVFKAVATGKNGQTSGNTNDLIDCAEVVVYHEPYVATDFTLAETSVSLAEGATSQITYTATPSYAELTDVTFTTSDPQVASVSATGLITAEGEGTATITVSSGSVSKTVSVTVAAATPGMAASIVDTDTQWTQDRYNEVKTMGTLSASLTAWKNDVATSALAVASVDSALKNVTVTASDFVSGENIISASNITATFIRSTKAYNGGYLGYGSTTRPIPADNGTNRSESADILWQTAPMDVGYNRIQPVWVEIAVPADAAAGDYTGTLTVSAEGLDTPATFTYTLTVQDVTLPDASTYANTFDVELWQYPYSSAEYYGVEPFSAEHLEIMRSGMEIYKSIGGHAITTTILEEAWSGQTYSANDIHYPSMIKWEKKNGVMTYDYSDFDAWVTFCKSMGIGDKIVLYSIAPWHNTITYWENGVLKSENNTLGNIIPDAMWTHFLNDLIAHLEEKDWFDDAYIGIDERGFSAAAFDLIESIKNSDGECLKTAGAMDGFVNKWDLALRVTDLNVGDTAVAHNPAKFAELLAAREAKGYRTTLYSCTEHEPGQFSLSKPVESYWIMLNAGKMGGAGFLRWAYDAWVADPLNDATHNSFEPGDCFLIFPDEKNAENPVSRRSVRLARVAEGVRDVNKLMYIAANAPALAVDVDAVYENITTSVATSRSYLSASAISSLRSETAAFKADLNELTDRFILLLDGATTDVESVTITDGDSVEVLLGGTKQLSVKVLPTNLLNNQVTWSSSDENIVTVVNGLLTGEGQGTATVTATSVQDPTVSDSIQVTVDLMHVDSSKQASYYSFDHVSGSTVYDEWSDYDATMMSGATVAEGMSGNALSVNTAGVGAVVNDNRELNDWTVAYWVKTTANFASEISVLEDEEQKYSLSLKMADGRDSGFRVGNGSGDVLTYQYNFQKDTWYHIAWVRDFDRDLKLYVNGTYVKDNTWTANKNTVMTPIDVIGGTGFTGLIDEVKIYNAPLSEAEIAAAMMVNGVNLSDTSIELDAGDTYQIKTTVISSNSDKSVTYTSADPKVATVSGKGLVTGVARGETVITVTNTATGLSAELDVKVTKSVNVHNVLPRYVMPEEYLSTIERAPGTNRQYLGQPDMIQTKTGRLITAYPTGHGKGPLIMQISEDGGLSWTEKTDIPASWAGSQETPTLYVLNVGGQERLLLITACPGWGTDSDGNTTGFNVSYSDDNGDTWTEYEHFWSNFSNGNVNKVIVAMASLIQLKDEEGNYIEKWMGVYHNYDMVNYKTYLTFNEDGSMNWSEPVPYLSDYRSIESSHQICEVGMFRSPDGERIVALARSQSHMHLSTMFWSDDEGETWSEPVELPGSLAGERHKALYDSESGKLLITFREIQYDRDNDGLIESGDWYCGDWGLWVGTYEQLMNLEDGEYCVTIDEDFTKNTYSGDTGYAGFVQLEDGTFVMCSYGHWEDEFSSSWTGGVTTDLCYIRQARFNLAELESVFRGETEPEAPKPQAKVEDVTLTLGDEEKETATYTDNTGNYKDADTSALDTSVATVAITAVPEGYELGELATTLESGKQYVLVNRRANKPVFNEDVESSVATTANADTGLVLAGSIAEITEGAVWTVTGSGTTYTIQDANGKYMTLSDRNAGLTESEASLGVVFNGDYWTISQNNAYLNDSGQDATTAAGWEDGSASYDAGSKWDIYEANEKASSEITFTAVGEGETSVQIGNVIYNITVDVAEPDASEPDASEPDASEPEDTKPEDTKPEDTKPDASEPDASEPDASEPDASEPDASEPEYTVPECDKDDNCTLSQFDDITVTEWYHDGIHFCVEEGIMNGMGEGKFAPTENTTRAQLVMMLYRLAGTPSVEGKTEPFTDVAENDWFYAPIVWAYENKVVNGVSDTEFAPNAGVTREQVATILHRYLGEPEGTGKLEEFPDVADVSEYAVAPLTWAVGEGLITGIAQADGTALLAPTGNATRAQIATILMRHLTK